MADEAIVNGAITDTDHTNNSDVLVADLNRKIEVYEEEKSQLIRENEDKLAKIKSLTSEIDGLKAKETKMTQKLENMEEILQQSEQDKRALQAITSRAAELEMEVSRLQHDLVSSMSGNEETVRELKVKVRELEVENVEKEERIKRLEKEKSDSVQEISAVKRLSVDKDGEIVVLVKEKGDLVREVEEMKRLKESEIGVLVKGKKEVEEELEQTKTRLEEMEIELEKAKTALVNGDVEEEMEIELEKAKTALVNGDVEEEMERVARSTSGNVLKSLNYQWAAPAVVASTAVVVGLYYVSYSKRN